MNENILNEFISALVNAREILDKFEKTNGSGFLTSSVSMKLREIDMWAGVLREKINEETEESDLDKSDQSAVKPAKIEKVTKKIKEKLPEETINNTPPIQILEYNTDTVRAILVEFVKLKGEPAAKKILADRGVAGISAIFDKGPEAVEEFVKAISI
jgi:hypothetical protein